METQLMALLSVVIALAIWTVFLSWAWADLLYRVSDHMDRIKLLETEVQNLAERLTDQNNKIARLQVRAGQIATGFELIKQGK